MLTNFIVKSLILVFMKNNEQQQEFNHVLRSCIAIVILFLAGSFLEWLEGISY